MKRSIFVLAAAALALGGCSSEPKPDDAAAKTAEKSEGKKAEKGKDKKDSKGKKAAADKPHYNPWAKDQPAAAAGAEVADAGEGAKKDS
ncbi:MAG TPA: hypothetical protein VFV30_04975 [Novosphingobium sp.]|nr:hypothetical protein [Novosphingobium sp.]